MIIFGLILAVVCAGLDQLIKYFVVLYLKPIGSTTVIPGLLKFVYIENDGAALGIFDGAQWFLIAVTSIAMIVLIWCMFHFHIQSKLFYWACGLIIGGGIGNLIDRIFYHYVVDYISVSFFPPICNFADYCVTAGAIVLIVYFLFGKDSPMRKNETSSTEGSSEK